jgi:hypothetical protein
VKLTSDVDLPDKLVTAARAGRLVLFIGAGVSLNSPSNLPLYGDLARNIAATLGVEFDSSVDPDRFLGLLSSTHPSVKEQVKAVTGDERTLPNVNHKALARLAVALNAPLVSTNYDGLIERAAGEEGISLGDRHCAPALPLGRQFEGIVYLHGAASRPAYELVVTDEDFGRAYLTEGWARRFVQGLFENWTVLFVGYSHNDLVMTYLARGLPPTSEPRYVLTDEPESGRWGSLRIVPISYPADHAHAALPQALSAWASLMEMGVLDHHTRARDLAAASPPKVPEEADYLSDVLRTSAGVRGFAAVATGYEWLRWVESQDAFQALFRQGRCESDVSRVLASWFVDVFVAVPDRTALALGTIARLGPVACDELYWELARGTRLLHTANPAEARKWTAIITAALRPVSGDSPLTHLHVQRARLEGLDALPLLRRALVPRLVLTESRSWFSSDPREGEPPSVSAEVEWAVPQDELERIWDAVSRDFHNIASASHQIAEQALLDAYQLLHALNPERTFDSWSFRRSAIEPHEQDQFADQQDMIIDILRDCSAMLPNAATVISATWLRSDHALFRRLGLHILIESNDLTPDAKCKVVLGPMLWDAHLKHEVFRLLATVASSLTTDAAHLLLSEIREGPPFDDPIEGVDPRFRRRAIFDRLEWLRRHEFPLPELNHAISSILADEPDMGVRPHPDLDHYMTSGSWGGQMPLTVEELREKVQQLGSRCAVTDLIGLDYSERNFEEPTWDDTCRLIREAAAADPVLGLDLMPTLDQTPVAKHHEMIAAVLHGWSQATFSAEQIVDAVTVAEGLSERPELSRAMAEFIRGISAGADLPLEPSLFDRLDVIAVRVWETNVESFNPGGWSDSLIRGLNTWPGIIAQYWLNRISTRWRGNQKEWRGLTCSERQALLQLLDTSKAAGAASAAVLAGKLHFLFAADSAFSIDHVFPLFDPSGTDFAPEAWFSFLHEPRTPPDLLDAGFWPLLVASVRAGWVTADTSTARRFWQVLASIATFSTARSVVRDSLIADLGSPDLPGALCLFIRALGGAARDLDGDGLSQIWSSWLKAAITSRQSLAPGVQTLEEKAAWGDLALALGTQEALLATLLAPGPIGRHTTFSRSSHGGDRVLADVLVRTAVTRLEVTSALDWHVRHELQELVDCIREDVDPVLLRRLAEVAAQRDITEALSWT